MQSYGIKLLKVVSVKKNFQKSAFFREICRFLKKAFFNMKKL